MTRLSLVALAGLAAAQSMSSPGGAIPAGLPIPNTAGFMNATIQPSRGGAAICVSGMVPVHAAAQNINFNFSVPANETVVTDVFLQYITQGSNYAQQLMDGMQNVSGTYNIMSRLCMPANGSAPRGVQLLTHGIGFDRFYWDFAPGYSYVDYAADQGYATFSYDRLGVGMSAKPDPIKTVQGPLEASIANQLALSLRNGTFSNASFNTVVGVGHSFGSAITQAVTAMHPTTFDAAILTGFSTNGTAVPVFVTAVNLEIAAINQPYRFAGLDNANLVASSAISNQYAFFRRPNFDPAVLSLADATKGTVTFGELFTLTGLPTPAANYTRPVAVVNGDADLPYCFGNCNYPTNLAAAAIEMLYPNAGANATYFAPSTGHGLNLHYTALAAYEFIGEFLSQNL